jgi:hypothetical protein
VGAGSLNTRPMPLHESNVFLESGGRVWASFLSQEKRIRLFHRGVRFQADRKVILYGRSQRNVTHWKIARFTTMFFDLRIKNLRLDLGTSLSHGFNSLNKLVEVVNTKTDPTPLLRGFGSFQRIGTFDTYREV